MNDSPNLLTIQQTAEFLQCSERSVKRLLKRKDFPSIKAKHLGRRILKDKLIPWLQSPAANQPAKLRISANGNTLKGVNKPLAKAKPESQPIEIVNDLTIASNDVATIAVGS